MNTALPTEAPTPQPVRTRYFLDTEFLRARSQVPHPIYLVGDSLR
jgi:hypothetical protein